GERVTLYRRAIRIATRHGLPTLSIRLSLAKLLLRTGQREAAAAELSRCAGEAAVGDESERASWAEVVAQAKQKLPPPGGCRRRFATDARESPQAFDRPRPVG